MWHIIIAFLLQTNINVDSLLDIAKEYHNKAVSGEEGALEKAERVFKKILKQDPQNPYALGWYGSLLTIKGRDAQFPFLKMKYVNEGLKYMDKAIALNPESEELRWVRAQNNLHLPYFFMRIDTAIVDLEYLCKNSKQEAYKAFLFLGKGYKEKGDIKRARACWQKVIDESKDTLLIRDARNLLKETEE